MTGSCRVPYGVTCFDGPAAERHCIDSTLRRPRHCKKLPAFRIGRGPAAPSAWNIRAYTPQEIRDGWRLACRTTATRGDTPVEVPPAGTPGPRPPKSGVGRPGSAAERRWQKPGNLGCRAEAWQTQAQRTLERVLAQRDDLEAAGRHPSETIRAQEPSAATLARGGLKDHRGGRGRRDDRGGARRQHSTRRFGIAVGNLGPQPRWWPPCFDPGPPARRPGWSQR